MATGHVFFHDGKTGDHDDRAVDEVGHEIKHCGRLDRAMCRPIYRLRKKFEEFHCVNLRAVTVALARRADPVTPLVLSAQTDPDKPAGKSENSDKVEGDVQYSKLTPGLSDTFTGRITVHIRKLTTWLPKTSKVYFLLPGKGGKLRRVRAGQGDGGR